MSESQQTEAATELIRVSERNQDRLESHGDFGDSYNDALGKVLDKIEGE